MILWFRILRPTNAFYRPNLSEYEIPYKVHFVTEPLPITPGLGLLPLNFLNNVFIW